MSDARMVLRNMKQFRMELLKADKDRRKAGEVAVKVEMFRSMKRLRREVQRGEVAGKRFPQSRAISRRKVNHLGDAEWKRTVPPLHGLAKVIRYHVIFRNSRMRAMFGFLNVKSSPTLIEIVKKLQIGWTSSVSKWQGIYYAKLGGGLSKRSSLRKYFFLRKTTTQFVTPPRPIIDPFWSANQREAEQRIISNFNRKMAGERI